MIKIGYTHYWYREKELSKEGFEKVGKDFKKTLKELKAVGVELAGWDGRGKPEINHQRIAFNGVEDGNCSHGSFFLELSLTPEEWQTPDDKGRYFNHCKTAHKPYDLAVIVCLIIMKHHLKKQILVRSDGALKQWEDGMMICQNVLGYGQDFRFDR